MVANSKLNVHLTLDYHEFNTKPMQQYHSRVETWQANKATWNTSDSVTKSQEWTATVYDTELQTVQHMQWLKKSF